MLGPKLLVGLLSLTASGNANPLTLDSLPRAKREMVTAKIAEIKTTLRENIQTLSKKKMPSLKGKSMDSKLMKFDEDDVSQHLRGLKMKDNFITYTTFLAEDCSSGTIYRTGFRLNYCLMNKDGSSFLYKVNKKQNFLVEFSYDGQNCKGIPTKANNFFLFSDPDAPVLDMCYVYPEYDDDDDDGDTGATAMILQYASTFLISLPLLDIMFMRNISMALAPMITRISSLTTPSPLKCSSHPHAAQGVVSLIVMTPRLVQQLVRLMSSCILIQTVPLRHITWRPCSLPPAPLWMTMMTTMMTMT
jgi:hypothetical protein